MNETDYRKFLGVLGENHMHAVSFVSPPLSKNVVFVPEWFPSYPKIQFSGEARDGGWRLTLFRADGDYLYLYIQ